MKVMPSQEVKSYIHRNFSKMSKASRSEGAKKDSRTLRAIADKFASSSLIVNLSPAEAKGILFFLSNSVKAIEEKILPAYGRRAEDHENPDFYADYVNKVTQLKKDLSGFISVLEKKL